MFKKIGLRLWQLDIWANHKMFNGNEGETISSRLGRYIEGDNIWKEWSARVFCRTVLLPLAFVLRDKDWKHCREHIDERYRKK